MKTDSWRLNLFKTDVHISILVKYLIQAFQKILENVFSKIVQANYGYEGINWMLPALRKLK